MSHAHFTVREGQKSLLRSRRWAMNRPIAVALPDATFLPPPFPTPVAINHSVLRVMQLTNYRYAIPAKQIRTSLRLIPPAGRGLQRRLEHDIRVAPIPHEQTAYRDTFGNEIFEVRVDQVSEHLTFAIEVVVETHCAYSEAGISLPLLMRADDGLDISPFLEMTPRTRPDPQLNAIARDIAAVYNPDTDPIGHFVAICKRVHKEMDFTIGATDVDTTAAQAWIRRRGVCQDYSHITLTLCRISGIAARYVSGFVPGEGVMHAWVEALLPLPGNTGSDLYWFAYDPTYNKWVNENYISIAVGRDYGDITPTSGTYFGGKSHLSYRNRVERLSKEVVLL